MFYKALMQINQKNVSPPKRNDQRDFTQEEMELNTHQAKWSTSLVVFLSAN